MRYVGQPLKRFEDPRLITGKGLFVDDVKLPTMLYAAFHRSPHAHARIRSIDVSAALDVDGIVAISCMDAASRSMPSKMPPAITSLSLNLPANS